MWLPSFHSLQNSLAKQLFQTEDEMRKTIDKFIMSKDLATKYHLPKYWQRVVEADGIYIDWNEVYILFNFLQLKEKILKTSRTFLYC